MVWWLCTKIYKTVAADLKAGVLGGRKDFESEWNKWESKEPDLFAYFSKELFKELSVKNKGQLFSDLTVKENNTIHEATQRRTLVINLDKETVTGDHSLLNALTSDNVTEVDNDDMERDNEGNIGGNLWIWLGHNDHIEIIGCEHFPHGLYRYNTKSKNLQQKLLIKWSYR